MSPFFNEDRDGLSLFGKVISASVVALAASAVASSYFAAKAEADNPPVGKFVEVDGVRLHYVEIGQGDPIVFLHGNGTTLVVVGHSWGTLVAVRIALDFPQDVARLLLLSGYYYPSARLDTVLATPGGISLLGNLIQHTIGPIIGRFSASSTIKKLFSPRVVSPEFTAANPTEMAIRPSQLKAVAAETSMMPVAVSMIGDEYTSLKMPVLIFAGDMDDVVDTRAQSSRLHSELTNSKIHIEEGVGHMIHHAIPERIADALLAA